MSENNPNKLIRQIDSKKQRSGRQKSRIPRISSSSSLDSDSDNSAPIKSPLPDYQKKQIWEAISLTSHKSNTKSKSSTVSTKNLKSRQPSRVKSFKSVDFLSSDSESTSNIKKPMKYALRRRTNLWNKFLDSDLPEMKHFNEVVDESNTSAHSLQKAEVHEGAKSLLKENIRNKNQQAGNLAVKHKILVDNEGTAPEPKLSSHNLPESRKSVDIKKKKGHSTLVDGLDAASLHFSDVSTILSANEKTLTPGKSLRVLRSAEKQISADQNRNSIIIRQESVQEPETPYRTRSVTRRSQNSSNQDGIDANKSKNSLKLVSPTTKNRSRRRSLQTNDENAEQFAESKSPKRKKLNTPKPGDNLSQLKVSLSRESPVKPVRLSETSVKIKTPRKQPRLLSDALDRLGLQQQENNARGSTSVDLKDESPRIVLRQLDLRRNSMGDINRNAQISSDKNYSIPVGGPNVGKAFPDGNLLPMVRISTDELSKIVNNRRKSLVEKEPSTSQILLDWSLDDSASKSGQDGTQIKNKSKSDVNKGGDTKNESSRPIKNISSVDSANKSKNISTKPKESEVKSTNSSKRYDNDENRSLLPINDKSLMTLHESNNNLVHKSVKTSLNQTENQSDNNRTGKSDKSTPFTKISRVPTESAPNKSNHSMKSVNSSRSSSKKSEKKILVKNTLKFKAKDAPKRKRRVKEYSSKRYESSEEDDEKLEESRQLRKSGSFSNVYDSETDHEVELKQHQTKNKSDVGRKSVVRQFSTQASDDVTTARVSTNNSSFKNRSNVSLRDREKSTTSVSDSEDDKPVSKRFEHLNISQKSFANKSIEGNFSQRKNQAVTNRSRNSSISQIVENDVKDLGNKNSLNKKRSIESVSKQDEISENQSKKSSDVAASYVGTQSSAQKAGQVLNDSGNITPSKLSQVSTEILSNIITKKSKLSINRSKSKTSDSDTTQNTSYVFATQTATQNSAAHRSVAQNVTQSSVKQIAAQSPVAQQNAHDANSDVQVVAHRSLARNVTQSSVKQIAAQSSITQKSAQSSVAQHDAQSFAIRPRRYSTTDSETEPGDGEREQKMKKIRNQKLRSNISANTNKTTKISENITSSKNISRSSNPQLEKSAKSLWNDKTNQVSREKFNELNISTKENPAKNRLTPSKSKELSMLSGASKSKVGFTSKQYRKSRPESDNDDPEDNFSRIKKSRVEENKIEKDPIPSTSKDLITANSILVRDLKQSDLKSRKETPKVRVSTVQQDIRNYIEQLKKRFPMEIQPSNNLNVSHNLKSPKQIKKIKKPAGVVDPEKEKEKQIERSLKTINGVLYKKPIRRSRIYWITSKLENYLLNKLKQKYKSEKEINRREHYIINNLTQIMEKIKRSKNFENYAEDLEELKQILAENAIVTTCHDFYCFIYEFIPPPIARKILPILTPYTEKVFATTPNKLFVPILPEGEQ